MTAGVITLVPVDSALGAVVGVLATAYPLPGMVRLAVDEAASRALSTDVREGLAWLASLAVAFVAFAASAWAVLRLMQLRGRHATSGRVTARADVVDAVTSRALADKRIRDAGRAAKDASPAALTPLPVEAGATYVHVGPRTAWVCPRRWPDSLDVTAIDTAIHRSVATDAHIFYVVRDATTDGGWPAALAAMVRRHQHLCPLPPRQRGPID